MTRNNYAVLLGVILIDQTTKFFARKNNFVPNSALPFGLDLGRVLNLAVLLLGLTLFIFLYFRFWPKASPFGFALIVGGALSNILERVFFGAATDFINLGISTVNLADVAIGIGIFILLVLRRNVA